MTFVTGSQQVATRRKLTITELRFAPLPRWKWRQQENEVFAGQRNQRAAAYGRGSGREAADTIHCEGLTSAVKV